MIYKISMIHFKSKIFFLQIYHKLNSLKYFNNIFLGRVSLQLQSKIIFLKWWNIINKMSWTIILLMNHKHLSINFLLNFNIRRATTILINHNILTLKISIILKLIWIWTGKKYHQWKEEKTIIILVQLKEMIFKKNNYHQQEISKMMIWSWLAITKKTKKLP